MKKSLLNLAPIFAPRCNNALEIVLYKKQQPPKLKIMIVSFVAGFVINSILRTLMRRRSVLSNARRIQKELEDQQDLNLIA